MATTEKMDTRHATTTHLRFCKTRMESPMADSCGGRSGYGRSPEGRPRSELWVGCISRMTGLLACTRGPESMPAPQRFCNCSKSPNGAILHNTTTSRVEEAGLSRRELFRTECWKSSGDILALDRPKGIGKNRGLFSRRRSDRAELGKSAILAG